MAIMNWSYGDVLAYLEERDTRMAELLREIGPLELMIKPDPFPSLVQAIISQQISTKAAESIYVRLVSASGGELLPGIVADFSHEELRVCGVSPQKQGYLIDLARHFSRDPDHFGRLDEFGDEEVIRILTQIKGIGPWTAQMFLMFTLGRPDVFAPDDYGLKTAMTRQYRWRKPADRARLTKTAAKWSPYRTIVCRYLWKSLGS